MKRISRGLILFLVVIVSFALVSCNSSSAETDSDTAPGDIETADTAAARGDEIEIISSAAVSDVLGSWQIHVLYTNSADYPVGDAEIEFVILGADGSPIHSENIYALPYGLSPGESQPVTLDLPNTVTAVEDFEVNIISLEKLETESVHPEQGAFRLSTDDNGIVTLIGEVNNFGEEAASIKSATAVLFSADDKIINTASCEVCTRYLSAGESGPLKFMFYGHPAETAIDQYEIYLSSRSTEPVTPFDVTFLEPSYSYTDEAGRFHLLGDLQNTGEKILDLNLLGTFYGPTGEIVGASSASLPMNSLLPGESSPFELVALAPLDAVADWSLQVDLARSRSVETPSIELIAQETIATPGDYRWDFTGEAVNNSDQDLTIVLVVIGLREKNTGKLVGLVHTLEVGEFPAGSTIPYELKIAPDSLLDPSKLESVVIVRAR